MQEKDPAIFCDFLSHWPPRKVAQRARRSTLETFFRDPHGRSAEAIAQRIEASTSTLPLPTEEGVIAPNALLVQARPAPGPLAGPRRFRHRHRAARAAPPDFPLCQALPEAGLVCASRLLVAFGEQRERDAAALQK